MEILSGNKNILQQAIVKSQNEWIVEMRLDADDGLNSNYVDSIREHTNQLQHTSDNVRIICVSNSISWHSGALSPLAENLDANVVNTLNIPAEGILQKNIHSKSCITPGLSYLLPPSARTPPKVGHHEIDQKIPKCHRSSDSLCFEFIDLPYMQSFQARTPTSHGMGGFHKEYKMPKETPLLWETLRTEFNVSKIKTIGIIQSFKDNIIEIARDNIEGQCTEDHTCEKFARKYLERIIWNKENESDKERFEKAARKKDKLGG